MVKAVVSLFILTFNAELTYAPVNLLNSIYKYMDTSYEKESSLLNRINRTN